MEDRLIENKAFRVNLLALEEVAGENGLKSVLNFSGLAKYIGNFPPNDATKNGTHISDVTKLAVAIEEIYGKQGARAILFHVGTMNAKWGLEENPDVAEGARSAMASMSEHDRAKTILTFAADAVAKQFDTETWVEEDGDDILVKDRSASYCFDRTSDTPVCHPINGFWAGLVDWAVGNKEWKARETECMAMGAPHCTCRISRSGGGR
jgi:predicted hydrocarbon binding protein